MRETCVCRRRTQVSAPGGAANSGFAPGTARAAALSTVDYPQAAACLVAAHRGDMHAELVRRRAARLAAGETRHRIDNDIRSGRVVVPFRGTQVDAGIALDLSIRAAAAAATQHSDL